LALQWPTLAQVSLGTFAAALSGWAEAFSAHGSKDNEVAAFATGQEGGKQDGVLALSLPKSLDRSKLSTTRAMSNQK
jgi:hypothetical protein